MRAGNKALGATYVIDEPLVNQRRQQAIDGWALQARRPRQAADSQSRFRMFLEGAENLQATA